MYARELAEAIKKEAENQLWDDFESLLKYKRERIGSGKNKGKKRKKPKNMSREQTDKMIAVFQARQAKGKVSGNEDKATVIIPISKNRERGYQSYSKTRVRKYDSDDSEKSGFKLASGGYNKRAKSDVVDTIVEKAFFKVAKKHGILKFTIKRSG